MDVTKASMLCRELEHAIRHEGLNLFVAYSHGNEDYVALEGFHGKVFLHRLDKGKLVGELHVEGEGRANAMAVSQAPSRSGSSDGPDRADATWLIVGDMESVVHIWDIATRRCILRLDAHKDDLEESPWFDGIQIAQDRRRVVTWDVSKTLLPVCNI
jgi:WD40 repeat protein